MENFPMKGNFIFILYMRGAFQNLLHRSSSSRGAYKSLICKNLSENAHQFLITYSAWSAILMKTPLSAFDVINGQWWHLQVTGYYLLDLEWKVVYTQKKNFSCIFQFRQFKLLIIHFKLSIIHCKLYNRQFDQFRSLKAGKVWRCV